MQPLRLLSRIIPAKKAVTMPEIKLGYDKEPRKNPIVPPRKVAVAPQYAPITMPMIGAVIAAAVIVCPGSPIIGDIFRKLKTVYRAANVIVWASSLVARVVLTCNCGILL